MQRTYWILTSSSWMQLNLPVKKVFGNVTNCSHQLEHWDFH
jgi:hypothetical protein